MVGKSQEQMAHTLPGEPITGAVCQKLKMLPDVARCCPPTFWDLSRPQDVPQDAPSWWGSAPCGSIWPRKESQKDQCSGLHVPLLCTCSAVCNRVTRFSWHLHHGHLWLQWKGWTNWIAVWHRSFAYPDALRILGRSLQALEVTSLFGSSKGTSNADGICCSTTEEYCSFTGWHGSSCSGSTHWKGIFLRWNFVWC